MFILIKILDFILVFNGTHQNGLTTYKMRTVIERELSCFKCNPSIQRPNTVNTTTMRSDLYLTAISKLINVIIADAINNIKYIRTIRKLFAIPA